MLIYRVKRNSHISSLYCSCMMENGKTKALYNIQHVTFSFQHRHRQMAQSIELSIHEILPNKFSKRSPSISKQAAVPRMTLSGTYIDMLASTVVTAA